MTLVPPCHPESILSSLLIRDAAILSLDRQERFIERGDIRIADGRIVSVRAHGEAHDHGAPAVDRVIEGRGLLAAPGLVNAHTHSPGALLAGTMDTESHPAFMWLNQADTSGRTPHEVYISAMLNAAQMLLSGVTTAIDHFPAQNFGPEDIAAAVRAYRDSGMRMVLAVRIFDDTFGDIFPRDMQLPAGLAAELERVAPLPPKPLAETRELTEDAISRYHAPEQRLSVFPAPTNPVRCTDALLEMSRDIAARFGVGIHTHLLESKVQTRLAQERHGCTMVEHLERLGMLSPKLSCAHTIWIDDLDIERLARHGVVVVHNPESNLKLGTGIAPIGRMVAAGVTVALGSDGNVTNDNQQLHEAMRLAACLGRVVEPDRRRWVTARQALAMATAGGAAAVGQPDLGRIEAGCRADIVLYDLDRPEWTPVNDPVRQMVFGETGASVHTVVVDGQVLVEAGHITAFDAASVLAQARPMLAAIRERNRDLYAFARRMGELFP
jgi:cytosine/adenosine deaminase-related metal-dependent hydrolase